MKLVRLIKDAPQHGVFAGEQCGFADDVAARMVAQGRAAFVVDEAASPEPEPEPVAVVEPEPAAEPEATVESDEDEADVEPVRRGPGRPRNPR